MTSWGRAGGTCSGSLSIADGDGGAIRDRFPRAGTAGDPGWNLLEKVQANLRKYDVFLPSRDSACARRLRRFPRSGDDYGSGHGGPEPTLGNQVV